MKERFPILHLLGQVRITRDGESLRFRSQKEAALLIYLAHTGSTYSREAIADLLWEARSTRQSLSNLRTVLTRLRKAAGDALVITRRELAYEPAAREHVDSVRLAERLAGLKQVRSGVDVARLRDALDLYKGDFLAEFYLPHAPRFNDWLVVEQERLRQRLLTGYRNLLDYAVAQSDLELGIETATRWLSWDELNEAVHHQLIRLLAQSGRPVEALAQYERFAAMLASELGVAPQKATTELYEQIRLSGVETPRAASAMLTAGQAATSRRVAHNLPREMTPFFGRRAEIEEVTHRVLDPAYPLVTLTGEGGIGKTRLSLAVSRRLLESQHPYVDGIWFVSLAAVPNSDERLRRGPAPIVDPVGTRDSVREELATATGNALGMVFHGQRSPSQQLLAFLREKACLLVLDNFEPLVDSSAVDLLLDLLQEAPGVHLLLTSRAGLDLNSEWVVRLDGLPAPAEAPAGKSEPAKSGLLQPDAESYDSVRLFAERATRRSSGFRLAEQLDDIAAICRTVAGLPLAIELAAAAVGRLSCAEIAANLQANKDLLATLRRDVPARQRSMRAVLEYSWRLLDGPEQRLLAQLSLFRGGFSREAAQAVTLEPSSHLHGLLRHSLLRQDQVGRYDIHPLLSQYAGEKLAQMVAADMGAPADAEQRHSAYFLHAVGELAKAGRQGSEQLAAVQVELDNIRRAWRWATNKLDYASLDAGWRGLAVFYFRRALFQEGEEMFCWGVERLNSVGSAPAEQRLMAAKLRGAQATFLNALNRYDEAIAQAQTILDFVHDVGKDTLVQATELDSLLARAEFAWGTALYRQGRFEPALAHLYSSLEAAQRAADPGDEATIRRRIGTTLLELGDFAGAQAHFEPALTIFRQIGDRMGEGSVLSDLGWLSQRQQNLDEALAFDKRAYEIQLEADNRHGASIALINMAAVYEMQGNFEEAYAGRQQVLRFLRDIDDRYHRTLVYHGLGVQLSRVGDYAAARDYYERSLAIDQELGDEAGIAWTANNLGLLYNHLGDFETALTTHRAALESSRRLRARATEGLAHLRMGQDLFGLSRFAEADKAYREAWEILQELEQTVWLMEVRSGLARVQLELGEPAAALALIEPVLVHLAENTLAGAREPLLVFWNCYVVLRASEDERASGLLQAASALMRRQAERIGDPRHRRSYIGNVRTHREIVKEMAGNSSRAG